MKGFKGCMFRRQTHLQEQSARSVREARQRVRELMHETERDRSEIDGLPPAGCLSSAASPQADIRKKGTER